MLSRPGFPGAPASRGALCAATALLLACGGRSADAPLPAPAHGAAATPAPAARRGPASSALGAPTAPASHLEFKAAGFQCADCHPCGGITTGHGATWMDPASPAFHALAANRSLADCQACHGPNLDGVGGQTTVGCQACHGQGWRTTCTLCHGATDNPTGAPPRATYGHAADPVRVGAHTAHVAGSVRAQGLDCGACHVVPSDALDPGHVDGPTATVTFGGLSLVGGAAPQAWSRAAPTCSGTYCHGNFKNGSLQNAPDWTKVGQGQAACGTCHGLPPGGTHPSVPADLTRCGLCHPASVDASGSVLPGPAGKHLDGQIDVTASHPAGWMSPVSPSFHAASANQGLAACQPCHGQDLSGGFAGVSCAQCHGAAWATTCTLCHGGAQEPSGAPPKATWGNAADPVRVGAHTAHVKPSASSPGFDCALCHARPADAWAAGHLDGPTASVQLTGLALAGGAAPAAWNRAGPTCAGTYCHGNFRNGNAQNAPDWTLVGAGQASCGTCHALPPAGTHPAVPSDLAGCATCHPGSVDASGAVKPTSAGGKHLDGTVDVQASHDPSWVDPASPAFHAFSANRGLAGCQTCHGADLSGGFSGVSCARCHGASWKTTCTLCHGGADSATGAPPRATWGQAGDTVRTGAHAVHVGGSARAQAYDCAVCHLVPQDALAAGHVDGPLATVTFGGLATTGALVPTWDRPSASCATTYCHGATLQGGTNTKPTWTTLDGTQARCGACHGLPPPAPHPAVTGGLTTCVMCHQGSVDVAGTVLPAPAGLHLDGKVEHNAYHPAAWADRASPGFHAFQADLGLASCQPCHGPALDGGSAGVACAQCHGAGWATRCATCHGGADNPTGAPPRATWGNAADPVRVGAHTSHVAAKLSAPIDCGACHVKPADAFAASHLGAGPAEVSAWLGWDRASATCATAACHGAGLSGGTLAKPVWTRVDGTQKACGTCHGIPPTSNHVARTDCGTCHAGYTATTVDAAAHVNGKVDTVPMTCTSCHGSAGGTATATSPRYAAPPVDTLGASTGLRVGAHQAHVAGKTYASGLACQDCHPGVAAYTTAHANGLTQVAFTSGTSASFDVGTYTPRSGTAAATCSNTWCHAVKSRAGSSAGGTLPAPSWTASITSCGQCHGAPPGTGQHTRSEHVKPCGVCHTGYSTSSWTSVDRAVHVNGTRDVGGTGTSIRSWSPSTRTCSPTCHGSETW